jgi:hypothetical protein
MSEITFQDVKKAYHTAASSSEVVLCYSGNSVTVKQIKMRDKKEFLKYLEKEDDKLIDTFIDQLLERYVSDEKGDPIDAMKLVDRERTQLLMKIRSLSTVHDTAEIDHICPKCNATNSVKFPLANLVVTNYVTPEGYDDTIVSKNGGVKFKIGNLTRGNVIEIEKFIESKKFDTDVEKEFVYLASTVKEIYVNVDDIISAPFKPSIQERIDFVENLTFDDFDKIKNYFAHVKDYGVSLTFDFKCSACDHKNEKEEAKLVDFFIK